MPLGKYYCDYCGKQFQDTPSSRKRHLQGSQHQRAKALYYDSFNPGFQLPPLGDGPLPAGVCHSFIRRGSCQYGDGCRYLHPRQNAAVSNLSFSGQSFTEATKLPFLMANQPLGVPLSGEIAKTYGVVSWGDLPPSLRPPPEGRFPSLPAVDWG